jgi:hypothetical protein
MRKKFNLLNLASKGRKGDTEIRRVNGRLSHVNQTEASAIDNYGKAGEAWTQSVGSGTINPQTGLTEYGFMSAMGSFAQWAQPGVQWLVGKNSRVENTWHPTEGDWGIFGSTKAAQRADKLAEEAAGRKASFESFMDLYPEEDVAAMQTADTSDGSDNQFEGTFEDFVVSSGISDTAAEDMKRYVGTYDPSKEQKLDLEGEQLIDDEYTVGNQLNKGLFGLAQNQQQTEIKQGFSSSGNFQQEFAREQAEDAASNQFKKLERKRETVDLDIGLVHTDYNKEFWADMMDWSEEINA